MTSTLYENMDILSDFNTLKNITEMEGNRQVNPLKALSTYYENEYIRDTEMCQLNVSTFKKVIQPVRRGLQT